MFDQLLYWFGWCLMWAFSHPFHTLAGEAVLILSWIIGYRIAYWRYQRRFARRVRANFGG